MTREQILQTVRDMLEGEDSAIGWDHVIEYLDGAIGEIENETRRKAYSDGYDAAQTDAMNGVFG